MLTKSNWKYLPFSEAFLVNPPSNLVRGNSYAYVQMSDVSPGSKSVYAKKKRRYRGSGSRFRDGDTLMARITPCLENGKIAQYRAVSENFDAAYGSTEFIVIRGRSGMTISEYGYYLTSSMFVRNYAIGQMTGTTGRQRVPTDVLQHLTVPLPPLIEQSAIANLLSTFDNKIELNHQVNATLQSIAWAIYKDLFLNFGPTQAKIDGCESYFWPEIFELFPSSISIDKIPNGWRVGTVRDRFSLTMGQSPPSSTYNNYGEGLPFFQGRSNFGFRYPENRRFCSAPSRIAARGDTLVSVRAPVGDINLAWEKCCIGRGVAALRHNTGFSSYTYYSAKAIQNQLKRYEDGGTVFGSITKKDFENIEVVIPPPEIVSSYEKQISALDQKIRTNVAENRLLIKIRDMLLPQLVSGAIHIGRAETMVENLA